MKIIFFGRLAQSIAPEIELEFDGCSERRVAELRDWLGRKYPQAADTLANRRSRVCVGDTLVDESYVIQPTDKVEFLPPVSGG